MLYAALASSSPVTLRRIETPRSLTSLCLGIPNMRITSRSVFSLFRPMSGIIFDPGAVFWWTKLDLISQLKDSRTWMRAALVLATEMVASSSLTPSSLRTVMSAVFRPSERFHLSAVVEIFSLVKGLWGSCRVKQWAFSCIKWNFHVIGYRRVI